MFASFQPVTRGRRGIVAVVKFSENQPKPEISKINPMKVPPQILFFTPRGRKTRTFNTSHSFLYVGFAAILNS
jgi:hypothetical protein